MDSDVLDKQQTSNKYHVGTNFNQERKKKTLTVQNRHLAIHRHDRKYKEKITWMVNTERHETKV